MSLMPHGFLDDRLALHQQLVQLGDLQNRRSRPDQFQDGHSDIFASDPPILEKCDADIGAAPPEDFDAGDPVCVAAKNTIGFDKARLGEREGMHDFLHYPRGENQSTSSACVQYRTLRQDNTVVDKLESTLTQEYSWSCALLLGHQNASQLHHAVTTQTSNTNRTSAIPANVRAPRYSKYFVILGSRLRNLTPCFQHVPHHASSGAPS